MAACRPPDNADVPQRDTLGGTERCCAGAQPEVASLSLVSGESFALISVPGGFLALGFGERAEPSHAHRFHRLPSFQHVRSVLHHLLVSPGWMGVLGTILAAHRGLGERGDAVGTESWFQADVWSFEPGGWGKTRRWFSLVSAYAQGGDGCMVLVLS